jgi:hypothetical protein
MKWILLLYPEAWRRRYGGEFLELLRTQRLSIGLIVDIAAGVVDAWLHPQETEVQQATAAQEDNMALATMMRQGCAGYGHPLTRQDRRKAAATTLGVALVLSACLLWWQANSPGSRLVSLWPMAFFGAYLPSLQFTHLKGRSARTRFLVIGGAVALFSAFFLIVGWIATLL